MPTEDEEKMKDMVKQAIHEWLDEQFAAFGRYTFYGLLSLALGALLLFVVWANGKH